MRLPLMRALSGISLEPLVSHPCCAWPPPSFVGPAACTSNTTPDQAIRISIPMDSTSSSVITTATVRPTCNPPLPPDQLMTVCDSSTKLTGMSVRRGSAFPPLPASARNAPNQAERAPDQARNQRGPGHRRSQVMDEIAKAGEQQAVNDKLKTNGFVHRANDKV